MMFGKKSLGFHCWDEKDEVILVRQERAHHTKDGRQVCVFPQNGDASRSWRGRSVGAALGISAVSLCVFVASSGLAWLGFEVGHVSSLFQLLEVAFLVTLAHQIEWFTRGQHHLEHCSRYT